MSAKFLSLDAWKSWERQGKNEFFTKCKGLIKAHDSSSPIFSSSQDPAGLMRAVYELIWQGMQGVVRKELTLSALEELVSLHCDMSSMILDVIGIIENETFSTDSISEERLRFCSIVKESEKFLSDKLLKERLEIETLQSVGTLKNKSYHTKFIKVKTKLYYKQRKFNLFREESEGYAKLVVELNQEITSSIKPTDTLEAIKSLIGCFNLDPNRVLDVILESFECRPEHHAFFIPLIRSYMADPKILCEVLGFKFSFYQGGGENTPESLYIVTALMLQYGIISLDDIYCWLTPDDKLIQKDWNKELNDAREYVRKAKVISIKEKEKEDAPEEKENVQEKYFSNQKFGLCEALLKVGDWIHTQQLTQKLPERCAMEQPPIARSTCQLVHVVIDPVYKKLCTLAPKIKGRAVTPLKNSLAVPAVGTLLGLRENAIPMIRALGPSLHTDPVLMYKVLRICKVALADAGADGGERLPQSRDSLYYDVITILDEVIFPSLSFMDSNCCLAEEIWNVIKVYPYQTRYCLYTRWKNESCQHSAKLMIRQVDAEKRIKSLMKRVSKENVKQVGRHIGKLTHCAPGVLFDYVLLQIQLYDNLIVPVVDSLKYLTSLSYDVLGCCLVERLAVADKAREKHDGTSIAQWLQSLSCFCGAVFKKYNIELTGLLQYVANQLKAQKSLDLLIVKEIVLKMAGIEAAEEMTAEQLDAMAGGDLLKAEAGYFSQVRNTKKSSLRLKEALWEQNLAVALCLLMAQQRYCVVYRETEDSHLKLVGWLYDQAQDTLVQFGTFLGSTLSVEEYVTRLPTIHSMLSDYHIHTDVAFFLARPMLNHSINLKYDSLRKADPNSKKLTVAQKHQKYIEATAEVMGPIVQSVRPLHPAKVWEDVSPQFLVTFWSLTMYDLHVPTEIYQREINKLKQLSSAAMDSKDMAASKSKKEQERYLAMMEKLQDEKKKQQEHIEKVQARLRHEKDLWFLSRSAKSAKNETITQFLQLCLFPRCVFTMPDAMYCAKFVHTIHSLKTPNFSTLLCYDRLFCDITYSVTSCTENEANRYGRFLNTMLETVMRWHSNKSIFEKECANYPGFVTKFRVSNQVSEACDHVAYENYRHVCHKWHYKITKAMVICLDSKDYVQIRNSLIILIKILPHFPVLNKLANIIQRKIEKVCDEEKNHRQDLFVLATSYSGQLKAKAATMIPESDFHQVNEKPPKNQDAVLAKSGDQAAKAQSSGGNGNVQSPSATTTAASAGSGKQINGDVKAKEKHSAAQSQSANATEKSSEKTVITLREGKEKERRTTSQSRPPATQQAASINSPTDSKVEPAVQRHSSKEKVKKEEPKEREERKEREQREREKDRESEPKEKIARKEERWEDGECHDKRPKDKKEERPSREQGIDRMYRGMAEGASLDDRYYERERDRDRERERERDRDRERERDRGGREREREFYSGPHGIDERELSSVSNSSSGSHRRSQEPAEPDRDVKRRKMDGSSSSKSSKHEERKLQQQIAAQQQTLMLLEQEDRESRRERSARNKEKLAADQEDKELRKERKLGRKRDRAREEALLMAEQKKRKEEEKASKLGSQNGDPQESHQREKHHYTREKSPYMRERSHDRVETREKHSTRRTTDGKRR